MAMSRVLVMVPLWSRYFCRTAWTQGPGQPGQGWRTPRPPDPRPCCPHLGLVLQGHVRGQQGHNRVPGRDVPLADLRAGVEVDQRGDEAQLLLGDAPWVDLGGQEGQARGWAPAHRPPQLVRGAPEPAWP